MAQHSPKSISVPIEPDALRSDVAHAYTVVVERARELEATGRTIFDNLIGARFDVPGDDLRDCATQVRCGARHAATLASELEAVEMARTNILRASPCQASPCGTCDLMWSGITATPGWLEEDLRGRDGNMHGHQGEVDLRPNRCIKPICRARASAGRSRA